MSPRRSRLAGLFTRSIGDDLDDTYGRPGHGWWGRGMTWNPGSSIGAPSAETSMRVSAVYACLRLIADGIGTLPAQTFERRDSERIPYPTPNYLQFRTGLTRVEVMTQVVMSLLTDGNAFLAIVRDRQHRITELVPLDPTKIRITHAEGRRDPLYVWGEHTYDSTEVLHIPGLVMGGTRRGLSPIAAAREVISIAADAQSHGQSWFRNASVPPAVIKVPQSPGNAPNQGEADRARAQAIAEAWHATHGGTSSAGRVGVLVGGADLQTVAVSNADSQWLESRQFSVQEIARIFGVPPHLVGDASGSTSWGSGLQSLNRTFGQFTLRPWITRIESAIDRLLFSDGHPDAFWRLNLDALLRADVSDRYDAYRVGIQAGFLAPNEARRLEELPPVEGGDDVLRVPVGASPDQVRPGDATTNAPKEGDDE